MGHITKKIKEQYLPEVIRLRKEGLGAKRISEIVPLSPSTIQLWLAGLPKLEEKANGHTGANGESMESLYRKFIQLYCVEKLPPARIVRKIPVCKATIYKWVAKFEASKQDYDIRDMKQRKKKAIVIDSDAQKEIDRLCKEVETLKRQLKTAELDKEAFQTLIKICERDYNISFTKKSGTKQ